MSSFIEQLKRRNVFRAALSYIAMSWVLLQIVDIISPIVGFPDSLMRILTVVLLLGIIPILVISWVYEITPEGLKKDSADTQDPAHQKKIASRMNAVVIALLVVAIGLLN